MKTYNIEAFVLKNNNYSDSDKLFTLFTKDYGKIIASAKGIRKISSKRRGSLDTLNLISAKITENTQGYKSINEVKLINSHKNTKKTLKRTYAGYYISELITRNFEENQSSQEMYKLYSKTLTMLGNGNVPYQIPVLYFELHFLRNLGYGINFTHCSKCEKKLDPKWIKCGFSFYMGGILCENCASTDTFVTYKTINILGKMLLGDFKFEITKKELIEADYLIKSYIEEKLGEKYKSLSILL